MASKARPPDWLPESFKKNDENPDASLKGYEYLYSPIDQVNRRPRRHRKPFRATAEKGEQIFDHSSTYLADAGWTTPKPDDITV